jgi:hypothetical protein
VEIGSRGFGLCWLDEDRGFKHRSMLDGRRWFGIAGRAGSGGIVLWRR